MLKFFAAAALIGAALLADGSQAQAGLFCHKKKCQPAPTTCCAAPVAPACCGTAPVVVVPAPMMVMPKPR